MRRRRGMTVRSAVGRVDHQAALLAAQGLQEGLGLLGRGGGGLGSYATCDLVADMMYVLYVLEWLKCSIAKHNTVYVTYVFSK